VHEVLKAFMDTGCHDVFSIKTLLNTLVRRVCTVLSMDRNTS